jgi:autotransporter-associated beta strand protein
MFNASTTAERTITLNSPQTVGMLRFGNSGSPSVGYALSGSGSKNLTLNNAGNGATITVTDGSHVINAPVILADNLVVTTGGTDPWMLGFGTSSSISDYDNGGYSLTMNGVGGTLILSGSNTYGGATNVNAGTLIVTNSTALPDGTGLVVGPGAALIFDPSTAAAPAAASTISAVPELGTLPLLGVGAIGLLVCEWQRWRRAKP